MARTRRDFSKAWPPQVAACWRQRAVRPGAFPSRTVRVVVPFPAGATTDMLARLIAQRLGETMGQNFVIETSAGGGGSIGADQVAKAAPDGHTLLFGNITFSTTTASMMYAGRARHTFDDFCRSRSAPMCRCCCSPTPACGDDLKQFVEFAKRSETPLFYGSTGPGSIMHLIGEVLKRDAGIKMDHIPFRGAAPLVTDMLAGRIHFGGDQLSSSLERVRSGQLKAWRSPQVGRATQRADRARIGLPKPRTPGLERVPGAQGHAGAGDRALCSRRSPRPPSIPTSTSA